MEKPGLGRSLGELLNGDKIAGSSPLHPAPRRGPIQQFLKPKSAAPLAAPETRPRVPRWFWFGCDLALLLLSWSLVTFKNGSLTGANVVFLAVLVTLGAALSIQAVLR